MAEKIEAILLDVEGCVTEPGGDKVPWPISDIAELSRLVRIMAEHTETYPPIAFCTGRQIPFAGAVGQALGVRGLSVVENGVGLYDHTTLDFYVNPVITREVLEEFRRLRKIIDAEILPEVGGRRELGKEVCISLNPPEGTSIEDYFNTVSKRLSGYETAQIAHSKSAVDITPYGVSKASGVKFWSEKTSVPLSKVLGVGDSGGDKAWLELVGYRAGPSNATAEIRQLNNCFISGGTTTRGVIDILYNRVPGLEEEVAERLAARSS